MSTIVTRSGKGSPLTNTEVDSNFTNLNTDKLELSGGTMTGNLSFGDSDKAIFGAGSDLEIYHSGGSGGSSQIRDVGTGNLQISANAAIEFFKTGTSEVLAKFNADSDVELYHDNAIKLATTSTGIDVTGNATFADNGKAIFGAGSDLQIYHDGANSRILENGTGFLAIGTNGGEISLRGDSFNDFMLKAEQNSAVTLYHNALPKLATTSTGIDITGTVTSDGLTVDLTDNAGVLLQSPNDSSTAFLKFGDSTSSDSGSISYDHYSDALRFKTINTNRMRLDSNGDISFYEDTGTTAKFFWDASAESLGIGGAPSYQLDVQGQNAGTDCILRVKTLGTQSYSDAFLYLETAGSGISGIAFGDAADTNVGLINYDHSDDSLYIRTNATEAMRIDSSGNVGIGTTDAATRLEVYESFSVSSASNRDVLTITAVDNDGGYFYAGLGSGLAFRSGKITSTVKGPAVMGAIYGANSNDESVDNGYLTFHTRGSNTVTEAMRIDSSGNVLVGTTSSSSSTAGVKLYPQGTAAFVRSGTQVIYANRLSSDGDIAVFAKDGTTVGSIGVSGTRLTVGSGGSAAGIRFDAAQWIPTISNVGSDNGVDIGWSDSRIRNLYLSGSIANPSGNLTLDASGAITLDADGGQVSFNDAGTLKALIDFTGNNVEIQSRVTDADLIFRGQYGSSFITALRLDMSEGGRAYFTNGFKLSDTQKAFFGDGNDLEIYHNNSDNNSYITETGSGSLVIAADQLYIQNAARTETKAIFTTDGGVSLRHNDATVFTTTTSGVSVSGNVTSGALDLTAIAKDISDTAVDVFVYDTSKDSDGGAWRKRTQHTSWYNETLNTATRGSRKEFPAVAVITVANSKLRIYDGDDPDMPMWMVFDKNPEDMLGGHTSSGGSWFSGVSAVNGNMAVPSVSGHAPYLFNVNFISEIGNMWHFTDGRYRYNGNISTRNDADGMYVEDSSASIVHLYCRDVAMTVLPNAPIDAATGLPVPTIAVATAGGVSVIKDDGTVVDIAKDSTIGGVDKVAFYGGNKLWTGCNTVGSGTRMSYSYFIPSADTTASNTTFRIGKYVDPTTSGGDLFYSNVASNIQNSIAYGENNIAADADEMGLLRISENESAPSTGMTNFITPDYNTGWMNGDIKLATLSDTDDTNVTGSNLIPNGDFSSNSGWTNLSGSLYTISGGKLNVSSSGSNVIRTDPEVNAIVGKTYVVEFTVSNYVTGTLYANFGDIWVTGGYHAPTSGTYSFTFTPTSTSNAFSFYTASFQGSIDNVSLRLAEADRSVNGKGLQVFGTVTKNPVATGADLVAYSGFSLGNYLKQPVNPDIEADGNWCAMLWLDPESTTGNRSYVNYNGNGTNKYGWSISQVGGALRCYTWNSSNPGNNSNNGEWDATFSNREGTWNHIVLCFDNAKAKFTGYLNGEKKFTEDEGLTKAAGGFLTFGTYDFLNGSATAKLALFRYSVTIPSPEQIKKIYEDEKVLFQENAQATLYGSSDAVTALAYDDSTELLHVGTSAGRSVFQGLRRVDNTTDAVGAAISASNGLVAED